MTSLTLSKYPLFSPIPQYIFEMGIFEYFVLGYTFFFTQFTKRLRVDIFECCSKLDFPKNFHFKMFLNICIECTFWFFQIPKEIENCDYWILVRKLQVNKRELEVFRWILSYFKTANLHISFNYHFRRVNFQISED